MHTVHRDLYEPKHNCFACKNGECTILTETHCKRSHKCGHFKTREQFNADLRRANARLKRLGAEISGKYKNAQKNNRVCGN